MLANVILRRLERYNCTNENEYKAALLEIIQEIALLGLWRSKFFEKAAFYGGTSLRILFGLDRFSEDLDFSLLSKNKNFEFRPYQQSVQRELESLGFEVAVEEKKKNAATAVQSAFIKANTRELFFQIGFSEKDQLRIHNNEVLKVKFEIDTDPPLGFVTEHKTLSFPGPFSVSTFSLPDLFAGKMHALLFRDFKGWVKGRDWYDYLWFIGQETPLKISHLEERMRQTGDWAHHGKLDVDKLKELLSIRVEMLNIKSAQDDIRRFVKEPWKIDDWSKKYFLTTINMIKYV